MGLADLASKQKAEQAQAQAQPKGAGEPAAPKRFGMKGATSAAAPTLPAEATATPVAAPGAKPAGLAARFGGLKAASPASAASAAEPAASPPPKVEASSLDSLEALSNATAGDAIAIDREAHPTSMLAGETAASAPTRELPADLEDGQKLFVESLDSIYDVLFDAELFGNITKSIMVELQENPEYIKLIAPEDVHTMIRGMRDAMGLARIKKVEGKRSPSGTTRAKKIAPSTSVAVEALDGMGFDDSDFV